MDYLHNLEVPLASSLLTSRPMAVSAECCTNQITSAPMLRVGSVVVLFSSGEVSRFRLVLSSRQPRVAG